MKKEKITYDRVRKLVESKDGILLTLENEFIDASSKIKIKCKHNHEWEIKEAKIFVHKNNWCRKCFANTRKSSIEKAKELAKERGGECLSDTYENSHGYLEWKCSNNHVWKAKYYSVYNNGRWCPYCNSSFSENCCRAWMEAIFKSPFPKMKLEYMRNSKGNLLELDGYCEQLGIAFEHNGMQHYKISALNTKSMLESTKINDEEKIKLCINNNIKLIIIPALFILVKYEDLKYFIQKECIKLDIDISSNIDDLNVNKNSIYSNNGKSTKDRYLKKLQELAVSKNGVLLSKEYINSQSHARWKCNICNHEWDAIPNSIRQGKWCPNCVNIGKKLGIEEMQNIASSHGGKCISAEYTLAKNDLEWECKEKHRWFASPDNIKNRNSWCPFCHHKKRGQKHGDK